MGSYGTAFTAGGADGRRSQRVEGGVDRVLTQKQGERQHHDEDGDKSKRDRDEAVDQPAVDRWPDSSVVHLPN